MEDTKTCLEKQPLSQEMLEKMNAYWRAANYLSAGQLNLLDNPFPKNYNQIQKAMKNLPKGADTHEKIR